MRPINANNPPKRIESVGIRSRKIRRLKAEKADRFKQMKIEAEAAAVGEKNMDKKRQAAAIKIQVGPK